MSELIGNEGSPQWDLQKLNKLFLPVDVANIARILLGIRAPPDRIVWHYDNHGVLTVKSAYRVIILSLCYGLFGETEIHCCGREHNDLHTMLWSSLNNMCMNLLR